MSLIYMYAFNSDKAILCLRACILEKYPNLFTVICDKFLEIHWKVGGYVLILLLCNVQTIFYQVVASSNFDDYILTIY